jgi:hypothetical protein
MQDPMVLILDESLEAIERGILTRTQCLERYPEHRGELAVLLDAALILRSAKLPTPNSAYFKAGRARLVAIIEQEQQLTVVDRVGSFFQHLTTNSLRLRTASIALLLAFLFIMLSGGTVYASAHALPGDTLYPLKTTLEDLRLAVTNDEGESALYEQFTERRLEEIQALAESGREDEIAIAVARFEETLLGASILLENVKPDDEAWAEQKADHLRDQLNKHLIVLEMLLDKVPNAAKPGIERAIAVTTINMERLLTRWENKAPVGPPEESNVPPEETGRPVGTEKSPQLPSGRPGGFGQPADKGKPEGVGKPEDVGKPDNVGKPDDLGKPEKEEKVKEDKDKDKETPEVETDD